MTDVTTPPREELSLGEAYEGMGKCPGGEYCPLKQPRCGLAYGSGLRAAGEVVRDQAAHNQLEIGVAAGSFELNVRWDDALPVRTVHVLESHDPDDPPAAPPKDEVRTLGFGNISVKGKLPEKGMIIQGSRRIKGPDDYRARGLLRWTLSPKPLPPIELKVEPAHYEDWRPQGGLREDTPGNHIGIRAWLETKGGGPVEDKAVLIEFTLDEVTREKGVCINFPPDAKASPDPDLKFLPEFNAGLKVGGPASAEKRQRGLLSATAVVSSFDWGAWGILKVRAVLESGREVVGKLVTPPELEEIPLPKSREGSWIADAWRKKTGAEGEDGDDDDDKPRGDGRKGDGLTLYEEYRGWHVRGSRSSDAFDGGGDPKTKEFFVNDRSGAALNSNALPLFEKVSGLRVIWTHVETEMDPGHVVNFNHGSRPRFRVEQHGVVVVEIGALPDMATTTAARGRTWPGRSGRWTRTPRETTF